MTMNQPTTRIAFETIGVFLLLASFSLAQPPDHEKEEGRFHPPEVVASEDARYPDGSFAWGTVVLDVEIGETGKVEEVRSRRDVQSLTSVATEAVKRWKFKPATSEGKRVRSRMIVAFTFNPPVNNPTGSALLPGTEQPIPREENSQFRPPEVIAASYARYPINCMAWGAVVLQASISETGKCEEVQVIRGIAGLTEEALRALKSWEFKPGMLQGDSLRAKMAIVFVFNPPHDFSTAGSR
jgi:TonB family protein